MGALTSLITRLGNNPTLLQGVLVPLEASINQLLQQDPATLQVFADHAGRLLCVQIDGFSTVYLRLSNHGVSLSLHNEAQPDVTMSGRLSDFIALAKADDKANQLINSAIDMDGDTELSITLTKVLQQLDIDWEALIQPLTGSLLAHQLGKGFRGLMKWGRSTSTTYTVAAKEYLEDEAQVVTPEPQLSEFASQVDELRLATDRLQARITFLES